MRQRAGNSLKFAKIFYFIISEKLLYLCMQDYQIIVVNDDTDIINMVNYIYTKGYTAATYNNYLFDKSGNISSINRRIYDINKERERIFLDVFGFEEKHIRRNRWYNFQEHRIIDDIEITILNDIVYADDVKTPDDCKRLLIDSIRNPVLKIKDLKEIYETVLRINFGKADLYKHFRKISDISFINRICIVKGINKLQEFLEFKKYFSYGGIIINPTDNRLPSDYDIPLDLVERDKIGRLVKEANLFYHIKNIIKFILI